MSTEKDEATSKLERLRASLVQSESTILEERKARQLLADENLVMQITIKEYDEKKTRMGVKNAILKEKLERNKASLKLAVATISDARRRVSQFLDTTLDEIMTNSFEEAPMPAYADNIDKCLELSFPLLDFALVNKVMGKINLMKQGIEAAEKRRLTLPRFSFEVPSSEVESDSKDEGDKDDAAEDEGDNDNDDNDDNE